MMRKFLYVSMVVGLVLQYYYFTALPDNVAHNFGAGGMANSFLAKESYTLFSSTLLITNTILFLLMKLIFQRVESKWINFPHKDHWLKDANKESSIERMTKWLDLLGCLINFFLLMVFALVFAANQQSPPQLDTSSFLSLMILFLLSLILWLFLLYRNFTPPEKS